MKQLKNNFLQNLGFVVLLNLIVKPFWVLGIDRSVQNLVGVETYGSYFAIFNLTLIFQILLDFGINNYNNRHISQNPQHLHTYFPQLIGVKILLGALYFILVLGIGKILGYNSFQLQLLTFLLINQVFLSFIMFVRSNLGALQLFKQDSIVSILDKLLMIVFCGMILYGFWAEMTIIRFIWAQTLAYLITFLISLGFLFNHLHWKSPTFSFSFLKKILQESYPYAFLLLMMGIYSRIDAVMLEKLLINGKTEAGIYAAAYRILDVCNQLGLLVGTLLLPIFSRMIAEKTNVQPIVNIGARMMWAGSILVVAVSFFYKNELMQLLYTNATLYYGDVFSAVMLAFVGMSGVYVFGTLLTANGSLKQLNIIAVSGMVLNIFLNFFLIKKYGAWGAAIATVVTQFIVLICQIWLSYQNFSLKTPLKKLISFPLFLILMVIWGHFSTFFTEDWILNCGVAVIGGVVLIFVTGLLDFKNLSKIFT